jgi:hypothetical protein
MSESCFGYEYISSMEPASPTIPKPSIRILVGAEKFTCTNSYIPAAIAKSRSPTVIMHYHTEKDVMKFVSMMLWMHKKFHPSIGILRDVPDEETSEKIEEACRPLLDGADDCIVILQ